MSRLSTQWSHHPALLYLPLCLAFAFVQNTETLATDNADALFHIECPPDTTVSCDAELWDLSIYGTAYVYGYGGPEPAGDPISVDYNLNSCGAGTITRTWVAYDYGNNPYYCSQVIYVSGGGYLNIHWPPDYTIKECNPSTDPEDLPPPYDFPTFYDGGECSQIMMNYEDLVFNINPPACIKILRKWTVIDWCTYDPNDWYPSGIWEHTQIIKVMPKNPPTIQCPADITASAGSDCYGGYVQIPKATGMSDCGADVIITNTSPYANSGGADASGHYPLGTTKVTFKAEDGCGGKTTCSMYVTVKDMKAPTPVCYYGISVSLMMMPEGYFMDLRPEFFNKGSYDNCTPDHKLVFDIEPKRVSCEDLGTIPVKVYVTDQSGNSAYCNTIVHVQDNNDICPPTDGLIAGLVTTPDGTSLEDVQVSLMQSAAYDMTDASGAYDIADVPFGHAYTVHPDYTSQKNMDGVSTLDLIILLKHLLGIQSIEDPYTFVAADVDRSGIVNVHDILNLRDLLIQHHFNIPVGTDWQFIDAAYTFGNGPNPLANPLPTDYLIGNFSEDMNGLDFIGVKCGDLSGEINYPSFGPEIETRNAPLNLQVDYLELKAGERATIAVSASEWDEIAGCQVGLSVDESLAGIVSVSAARPESHSMMFHGTASFKNGSMAGVAFFPEPVDPAQTLFTIEIEAKKDTRTDAFLSIAKTGLETEAYSVDYEVRDIELVFEVPSQKPLSSNPAFDVTFAFPNPFQDETQVVVFTPTAEVLTLEVFDARGALVFSQDHGSVAGMNYLAVNANQLPGDGVYVCRITGQEQSKSIRIVSQKWD